MYISNICIYLSPTLFGFLVLDCGENMMGYIRFFGNGYVTATRLQLHFGCWCLVKFIIIKLLRNIPAATYSTTLVKTFIRHW